MGVVPGVGCRSRLKSGNVRTYASGIKPRLSCQLRAFHACDARIGALGLLGVLGDDSEWWRGVDAAHAELRQALTGVTAGVVQRLDIHEEERGRAGREGKRRQHMTLRESLSVRPPRPDPVRPHPRLRSI